MRILCFPSPKVEDGVPIYHPLSLAADRHLAVMHGRELHMYDLQRPDAPVVRIPAVVDHALASTCLTVADVDGKLVRWEPRQETSTEWEPITSFLAPDTAGAVLNLPSHLLLSPSGRYLLIESEVISRAYLLNATTGEVKRSFDLHITWVRGGFAHLPSGEEVLFISADSYMSVQMVACASGKTLHAYTAQHSWDFCHTHYSLTASGMRLLSFGCVWAAPYEARIYDVTPWTKPEVATQTLQEEPQIQPGSAAEAVSAFPLPLVFRQEEVFGKVLGSESVLPLEPQETDDGNITSVDLVDLARFPGIGSPLETEALSELTDEDQAIYGQLSLFPRSGTGVVTRRVNPITGEVAGWSALATAKTDERHVHVLRDHRVLIVNDRIKIINGITGEMRDEGPFEIPVRWFSTLPTTSGDTLVVYWSESAPPN